MPRFDSQALAARLYRHLGPKAGWRCAGACLVLAVTCSTSGLAATPADQGEHGPGDRHLTEKDFREAPKDLVLWGHLAKVGVTRKGGRQNVIVLPAVQALDGKMVTLVGFMTQVHRGDRSKQFLLGDKPFLCDDCHASPGPAEIVEVNLKAAEPKRSSSIMVRGKLQVLKDDPNGLIYRLTEAKVIRRNQ
jgi:uncharacterized protein